MHKHQLQLDEDRRGLARSIMLKARYTTTHFFLPDPSLPLRPLAAPPLPPPPAEPAVASSNHSGSDSASARMRCKVAAASAIARARRGRTRDERSAGDRRCSSWRSAEQLELTTGDGKDDSQDTVHSKRQRSKQASAHKGARIQTETNTLQGACGGYQPSLIRCGSPRHTETQAVLTVLTARSF